MSRADLDNAPLATADAHVVTDALGEVNRGDYGWVKDIVRQQLTAAQDSFGTNTAGFADYQKSYAQELEVSGALPVLALDWSGSTAGSAVAKDSELDRSEIRAGLKSSDTSIYDKLMLSSLDLNYDLLRASHEDGAEKAWYGREPDLDVITRGDAEAYLAKSESERLNSQYRDLVTPFTEGINPLSNELSKDGHGKDLSLFLLLQYQQTHPEVTRRSVAVKNLLDAYYDSDHPLHEGISRAISQ